jgi:hypothetical protein
MTLRDGMKEIRLMTPFADTPHQRDDRSASILPPFLPKRSSPDRPVSGTSYSIYRHPPDVERAAPNAVLAPEDHLGNATLAFDAIHDAFQAQCTMLRAFAQLRGDEGADVLW